jgi:hypothetical protein
LAFFLTVFIENHRHRTCDLIALDERFDRLMDPRDGRLVLGSTNTGQSQRAVSGCEQGAAPKHLLILLEFRSHCGIP